MCRKTLTYASLTLCLFLFFGLQLSKAQTQTVSLSSLKPLSVWAFRSADDYETRGEAMANDLADGLTPEIVANYRRAILKLRNEPGIINKIYQYKDQVYETVLPGYGKPSKDVPGGSYFVIGPEKQMQAYETYLKSVDGANTNLFRLYPRDFWVVDNGE